MFQTTKVEIRLTTSVVGESTIRNPRHKSEQKLKPERKRFSVPHASRDPRILKDMNLENEDIFEIIRNPPEVGAVQIFENPEFWD